jgi:hypothetical protein
MAIEFVQINTATATGARIAVDVVTGATPSDNISYQAVQLVKGADSAAKTLVTSGDGLPVIIDSTATTVLGAGTASIGFVNVTSGTIALLAGTATVGSVNLSSPTGASLTTDGVLKNIMVESTATTVLGGSTATVGFVKVSETTATTVLGAGTATIGSVVLVSPTGASLTTDGVLKTSFSSATMVLGAGTATIGTVILNSASGGSLTTDGSVKVIPTQTATTVLGGGTATIGTVILNSPSGNSLTTDGILLVQVAPGGATIGIVTLTSDSAVQGQADQSAFTAGTDEGIVIFGYSTTDALTTGQVGAIRIDNDRRQEVVVAAGTATMGTVGVGITTATYVLGGGTATVGTVVLGAGTATFGSVILVSPSGGSLTTDGVLKTDAGSNIVIDSTTATYVLGGSTATIGRLGPNTATIGVVGLSSGAVIAAGTASIGTVYAADKTDVIHGGAGTAYTPKFAIIEATASGATQVVSSVTNAKVRVLSGWLIASAGANVEFRMSTASDNNITGLMQLATTGGSGWVLPYNPVGHFETTTAIGLYIYSDTAVNIGGAITYIEAT